MPLSLETERLLIRPLDMADAPVLHEKITGDPDVMRVSPEGASPSLEKTREDLAKVMARENEWHCTSWAVVEKETGQLVGTCGLIPVEGKGPDIELTYYFAKDVWGRGYCTEAVRAVLDYGFDELGIDPILAMTFPDHKASWRVMEKAGMRYVERTGRYYKMDLVVYSLSKDERGG